jgi:hypothetical protein
MQAIARVALTLVLLPVWIVFAIFSLYCAACDLRDVTER